MSAATRARRLAAGALLGSGALPPLSRLLLRGRLVVLAYHRIGDGEDAFFPSFPAALFARQMDYLRRSFPVVPFSRGLEWLRSGAPGPPRAVVTIDDGYADTYRVAFPILRERGLEATLFLSTAPLEAGEPLWIDRLRHAFRSTRETVIADPLGGPRPLALGSTPERLEGLRKLVAGMKDMGPQQVEDTLETALARLGVTADWPPVLDWDQVRTMADSGIELGGHTHRHYVLSRCRREAARTEIETGLALIAERTGTRPVTFAYPNGTEDDFGPETREVLREVGVTGACTMVPGFASGTDHPFELPRLHGTYATIAGFACRISGLGRERLRPPAGRAVPAPRPAEGAAA